MGVKGMQKHPGLTSIESSWESKGGCRPIRLAVPSRASLSSFRKTPQKGTTLQPGMLRARFTTFLYSEEDSCCAMASFRLLMVSMSAWSMNCHIFNTFRDLSDINMLNLISRHGNHIKWLENKVNIKKGCLILLSKVHFRTLLAAFVSQALSYLRPAKNSMTAL